MIIQIAKPVLEQKKLYLITKRAFDIVCSFLGMVVAGHGLIQERQIGSDEKIEFEVSGGRIQAVHMLPGYTHNIINLSETENLVTVMWANEQFDPSHPDTYFEEV